VHSRAFRRLEAKTQVFAPGLSDHFRNRLTHTIEVAQIARTLASVLRLDEDLTEALALAHDIGHPPFAHAGEEALDSQMRRFGDRFDHNLHALRIVESFEQRYARFPGLNLTFEMREGMVKHSHDFGPGEQPELEEYLPGLRPVLEAQLIDLADEVAYNTADLDDAFSAGLLNAEDIAGSVPFYRELLEAVETQYPGATDRERFHESLRQLVDALVSGLLEGTVSAAQSSGVEDAGAVRAWPDRIAAFTPETARTSRELKEFLYRKVYASRELGEDRGRSMAMIAELFQFFVDDPERLPEAYSERARQEPAHRVVCDYVAGMTDGFFRRTFEQSLGPTASLPSA
jgi:dGTPase